MTDELTKAERDTIVTMLRRKRDEVRKAAKALRLYGPKWEFVAKANDRTAARLDAIAAKLRPAKKAKGSVTT